MRQASFDPALGDAVRGLPVIAGFPGPGLAGGIALEELFQALAPEPVAVVAWERLAPQAVVDGGRASWPVQLARSPSAAFLKVECDVPGPLAHAFARGVLADLARARARELLVLEGLTLDLMSEGETPAQVWSVAQEERLAERLVSAGAPRLEDGALGGLPGAFLLWGEEFDLPVGALVSPTHPALPDPRAAANLLAPLDALYGLPIDPGRLRERADALAEEFGRLARRLDGDGMEAGMYT